MPNRILKDSICTSDNVDELTAFQETFFYRLIVNCDDYGRMDARAKILAARLFPLKSLKEEQVKDALRALADVDLILIYEVDGRPYLQMKTWERHQQVRARKSKYPSPDEGICKQMEADGSNCLQMISDDSKCPRNPIQSESRIRIRIRIRIGIRARTPPTLKPSDCRLSTTRSCKRLNTPDFLQTTS